MGEGPLGAGPGSAERGEQGGGAPIAAGSVAEAADTAGAPDRLPRPTRPDKTHAGLFPLLRLLLRLLLLFLLVVVVAVAVVRGWWRVFLGIVLLSAQHLQLCLVFRINCLVLHGERTMLFATLLRTCYSTGDSDSLG